MEDKDRFLKKLIETFKQESDEHLKAISSGLLELENASPEKQVEIIETIFRETHSLKGAARSVNMMDIVRVSQSLENVFAAMKRKEIVLSPELFDILHRTADGLLKLLSTDMTLERSFISELVQSLESTTNSVFQQPVKTEGSKEESTDGPEDESKKSPAQKLEESQSQAKEKPGFPGTIRISTTKLDSILLQTEELISAKLVAGQRVSELKDILVLFTAWRKKWSKVQPEIRKLNQTLEKGAPDGKTNLQYDILIEFLDWIHTSNKSLENKLMALAKKSEQDYHSLDIMIENLLSDTKKVLMLPFSSVLEMFPKFARDISRESGKDVELVIQGDDIEIDRRILELMKDPLIHLVRNCIDHGIEKPDEREKKKKNPRGMISIAISQNNSNVEILVSDDGDGIDVTKVKAAAINAGIISKEDAKKISEQKALSLIYASGVTTSQIITDISGRGLGLAIVRDNVDKFGGAITVETYKDAGTIFRIILPVTFATFEGIIARVNEHLFVLPAKDVERVVKIKKESIKTVGHMETIQLNGRAVSLVRLGNVLELPQQVTAGSSVDSEHVVVLASAEKRIAYIVDAVIAQQEILAKPLSKQLYRVRNIAGATILGDGKVVPVLNVSDLLKSAILVNANGAKLTTHSEKVKVRKRSILVVEDSITARTLLKNILESAGFDVRTAVDGVDGFTQLRSSEFDIVVSDVDMPRMNGFELTEKIRNDKKLSELPVVLVTGLESREDREHGIEVGANAYIVKSSFDQSNLLEVIQRLI